ncbi:hypothetical protein DSB65_03445 [Lactobacillus delbrueckii]|nr:hypothetical protein [Lactobacillus delbrueckii]
MINPILALLGWDFNIPCYWVLTEVQEVLKEYVYWFNNVRRSNKLKYTTSVQYRDRVMATI